MAGSYLLAKKLFWKFHYKFGYQYYDCNKYRTVRISVYNNLFSGIKMPRHKSPLWATLKKVLIAN